MSAGVPAASAAPDAESGINRGRALVVALESSLPDAGVAAALVAAGAADAVVLASGPTSLGDAAAAVVSRHAPEMLLIVGGTAALSADIEAELSTAAPGASLERLAGDDRVATSVIAARRALGAKRGKTIVIANGWSAADVGVAAALVASGGADVVLYGASDGLAASSTELLDAQRPDSIVIVGGTAALSDDFSAAAATAAGGASVQRLGGATRVHTAALVARSAAADCVEAAVIANAWSDVDVGIAAGLVAALNDSVVLYAQSADDLSATTRLALNRVRPQIVLFVGDIDALADSLKNDLVAEGFPVMRVNDAAEAAARALQGGLDACAHSSSGGSTSGASGSGSSRSSGDRSDDATVFPPDPVPRTDPVTPAHQDSCPSEPPADSAFVSGTITYRERIELTSGAVVTMRLSDISRQDSASVVIAGCTITNPGQVPFDYVVPYASSDIDTRNRYAVSAKITESDGRFAFINDISGDVITYGHSTREDLTLKMVVPPPDLVPEGWTSSDPRRVEANVNIYTVEIVSVSGLFVEVTHRASSTGGCHHIGKEEITIDGTDIAVTVTALVPSPTPWAQDCTGRDVTLTAELWMTRFPLRSGETYTVNVNSGQRVLTFTWSRFGCIDCDQPTTVQ